MDKILITGVAGFLGSNLANKLLQNENNFIFGIDNFSSSTMSNLYPLLKNSRFEFIEHDLFSKIPFCVEHIYHLAGNGDLTHYFNNKYDFILNKIEITKNIIKYTKSCGAKLILTTSYLDYQEKNIDLFQYFDTLKLIEDLVVEQIKTNKLNATFARLGCIYGENLVRDDKRFILTDLLDILNDKNIELNFDEKHYFTYVQDVIQNLEKMMNSFNSGFIYDIFNPNLYLKSDFLKLIAAYSKAKSEIKLNSTMQNNPNYKPNFLNNPYTCNTSILDGILNTIKYYKLMYFS